MRPHPPVPLARRHVLQSLGALASASLLPLAWAGANTAPARLVLVFLRGAYDGLSAFVPWSDPHYYRLRPTIALPEPGLGEQSCIKLDAHFALHPALRGLLPLWQQGVLAFVPAAGSPDEGRSHFEAQHHWEIGIPGRNSAADGWLNTLAQLRGASPSDDHGKGARAITVGEANPPILMGSAPVQRVPRGQAATRAGVVGDERTRAAMLRLYSGTDPLSQAFQEGAASRMQTSTTLREDQTAAEMSAADNGARGAGSLAQDARHLGTLMRHNPMLSIGFLSAGGWDTHANQGAAEGALARNLQHLADALLQLRQDFSGARDIVMVVSEFGRTSAENGTRGTDHGHGNAIWLMGNQVNGGRWHGRWDGLAPERLHQGRDLPAFHDFRGVFSQVLGGSFGLSMAQRSRLFANAPDDGGLQLLRT